MKRTWNPGFLIISFIFYSVWLRSGLFSERVRGDVYSAERPSHAHYSLNIRSGSFASRNQLKKALKTNVLNVSYWVIKYFVHASIVLILKPIKYLCSLWFFILFCILFYFYSTYQCHSWLDWVWRLVYCHTYWFFASIIYENSF